MSEVDQEDRTSEPGAETSGLTIPLRAGPRLEKEEMASAEVVDPTPITRALSPGELADPQLGPEFPLAKTGTMLAVCQELMMESNQVWP